MSKVSPTERAAAQYLQNRRRQLQRLGQWQPRYVDAEPVRAHILALKAAGMSEPALARRLGLPETAFCFLLRGDTGRAPGRTVARETAEAVLGYWPTLEDFPDTASIDPTGTRRRVQALQTLGWSRPRLGAEIGITDSNFKACLRNPTVSARFARKVAGLYDRLWSQRPEDHGVKAWVADRIRRDAAAAGYASPLAWDDDTIDDPKAQPVTDADQPQVSEGGNLAARYLAGEAVILDPAARKEVLAHRFEWSNQTIEEIAEELGMSADAAETAWSRMKRAAKADGRRLWRRAYVRREPNLKQDDMGEAA